MLEAAACGRPIVATDVPGCREVARPGLNALLVPRDDAKALADAVAQLAKDAALRTKFGAASRTLIEREFSSARIGAEIVAAVSHAGNGAAVNTPLGLLGVVTIAAAVITSVLIVALRPLLVRYALARPNARSSHREPTPQGGGIAVIAAALAGITGVAVLAPHFIGEPTQLGLVLAATSALALVGATDDIHPLEAVPRLLLQSRGCRRCYRGIAARTTCPPWAALVVRSRLPFDRRHLVREPVQLHGRH